MRRARYVSGCRTWVPKVKKAKFGKPFRLITRAQKFKKSEKGRNDNCNEQNLNQKSRGSGLTLANLKYRYPKSLNFAEKCSKDLELELDKVLVQSLEQLGRFDFDSGFYGGRIF
jgi:hypothetical protein